MTLLSHSKVNHTILKIKHEQFSKFILRNVKSTLRCDYTTIAHLSEI